MQEIYGRDGLSVPVNQLILDNRDYDRRGYWVQRGGRRTLRTVVHRETLGTGLRTAEGSRRNRPTKGEGK